MLFVGMRSPFDPLNDPRLSTDPSSSSSVSRQRSRSKDATSRRSRKFSRSPSQERRKSRTRSLSTSKPKRKEKDSALYDDLLNSTTRKAPKSSKALLAGISNHAMDGGGGLPPLSGGAGATAARKAKSRMKAENNDTNDNYEPPRRSRSRSRSKERKAKSSRNLSDDVMIDDEKISPMKNKTRSRSQSKDRKVKSSRNVLRDSSVGQRSRSRSRSKERKAAKSSRGSSPDDDNDEDSSSKRRSRSRSKDRKAKSSRNVIKDSSVERRSRSRSRSKERKSKSSRDLMLDSKSPPRRRQSESRGRTDRSKSPKNTGPGRSRSNLRVSKSPPPPPVASPKFLSPFHHRAPMPLSQTIPAVPIIDGRSQARIRKSEIVQSTSGTAGTISETNQELTERVHSRSQSRDSRRRSSNAISTETSTPTVPISAKLRKKELETAASKGSNEELAEYTATISTARKSGMSQERRERIRSRSRSSDSRGRRSSKPSSSDVSSDIGEYTSPKDSGKHDASEEASSQDPKMLRRAKSWLGLKNRLQNQQQEEFVVESSTRDRPRRVLRQSSSSPARGLPESMSLSKTDHDGPGALRRSYRRSQSAGSGKDRNLSKSDHGASSRSRRRLKDADNANPFSMPVNLPLSARRCFKGEKQDFVVEREATEGPKIVPEDSAHIAGTSEPEKVAPVTQTRRLHIARGRNDMLRNMESEYRAAQVQKEQDDKVKSMRQQLEEAKDRWVAIKLEGDAEIEARRRIFALQKEEMLREHVEAMNKLGAGMSFSQEMLRNENEALKAEFQDLSASLEQAHSENTQLEAVQQDVKAMFESLTAFVLKKTRDKKKLDATITKLGTILRGAMALKMEGGIKNMYRRTIYKCLGAIHSADMYDHVLYTDVAKVVEACEKEVGGEFLDEVGQNVLKLAGNKIPQPADDDNSSVSSNSANDDENFDVAKFTQDAEKQSAALSNMSGILHEAQISSLYENRDMLVTIFKFLDKDGGGTIDREEFRMGIDLLNRRLPVAAQFQDPDVLFDVLDVDGSGEIDLDEFEDFFAQSSNITEQTYEEW